MPTILDRAIEYLSPEWGAKRLAHREVIRFGYRAATQTRISGRGRPLARSADGQLERGWDRRKMVDRSRQLERDSALAAGCFDRYTENTVGPNGIRPRSTAPNKDFGKRALDKFLLWAGDRQLVDVRAMANLWELQPLLFRSKARDGDVGAIKLSTGHLQGVESHQIASPSGSTISSRMVDGIELDSRGAPLRYYVVGAEQDRGIGGGRRRPSASVPAGDMIFDARRLRLNQTRGTPILSGSAHVFDQVDGYLEAVITAARMAACFGLVLHSKQKRRGLPTETDIDGNAVQKMRVEPAKILQVGEGDKVTQINPSQPGSQFDQITATFGRLVGIPFGMPLEVAFLDFSRTNYSSARAALLQAYRAWKAAHAQFCAGTLKPIWDWKITSWIEAGELEAPAGLTLEQLLQHEWDQPSWAWIDPLKEIEATLLAVDGGLDALQDVACRMGGGDWFKLLERRKVELEAIEAAGIEVGRSKKTRPPGASGGSDDQNT